MLTLINPPSKLHYLRSMRSPALLGCGCDKYNLRGHPALRGIGALRGLGDATGAAGTVPAGTVLAYSATWSSKNWVNLTIGWNDPNAVQSAIQGNLAAQWGIIIDQQQHSTSDIINTTGQSGFVLQVHTNSDYGAPGDIQKIIDGAIYAVGNEMPNSTIRVVQSVAPAGSPGTPPNPYALYPAITAAAIAAAQAGLADAIARGDTVSIAQFQQQIAQLQTGTGVSDPLSWLQNNWIWLAAAGIGLVAVKELV